MNLDIKREDITSKMLKDFIKKDLASETKQTMIQSDIYYNVKNAKIMDRKKMMMLYTEPDEDSGIEAKPYLKEDFSKANNKAKHSYLSELVNQCTNYLAGRPLKINYKKDISDENRELIDDELYKKNNFLKFIQKNVTNVQLYGKSFMRIVRTEEVNKLIVFDPKEIIMFYNDLEEPILAIRYFTKSELDETSGKIKDFLYAEVYDKTTKDTWRASTRTGDYDKLSSESIYANKITYSNEDGEEIESKEELIDTNVFPIIEWKFNDDAIPTLVNIKDFIDLQDLNLSDLANNVEDIQEAIWILENYNGQNLSEFMEDLKVKKSIKVGQGGSAKPETIDIPIEARTKLYELCDKNIYKFGFGINFSERDNLGNVSGVALKWSYAPLEQKSNSIDNYGQEALNQLFNILFKLMGMDYDSNDLEFVFDRTMIANEQEQTSTVMSASSVLSQKTILSNLPMVKDVEEEIEELEGEEEYEPKVPKETVEQGTGNEEEGQEENKTNNNLVINRTKKA